MKKISLMLLTVCAITIVTGCGEQKIEEQIAICTIQKETYTETTEINGSNGEVTTVDTTYEYENSAFGIDASTTITDEQKQMMVDNMYKNIGFEKDKTYDGFEINITFKDKLVINFGGNVKNEKAKEQFKKLGIDFSKTSLEFDQAVQSYKNTGYTCK